MRLPRPRRGPLTRQSWPLQSAAKAIAAPGCGPTDVALNDPLFATAPTIEVGGQSYPLLQANLVTMIMREALGGLSSLELSFIDSVQDGGASHYAAGPGSPLELGAGVRVFAGAHEQGAPEIFDGQITAVEGEIRDGQPPLFTVLAEDRLFPLRRKRRTVLFEDKSLGDVITKVCSDHHLTAQVREGVDAAARNWVQTDETDLAFLRRICSRFDCDLQVVGDQVQIGRIGQDRRALIPLAVGSTLIAARITADIADQVSSVIVSSFDPGEGSPVLSGKDAAGFGPGRGKTGKEVLADKFDSVAMRACRHGPLSDADGDRLAEIDGQRRARGFVRVDGVARGNGSLRVGSWVELAGVNPQFANLYTVYEAVHRFDSQSGYRTEFRGECAYLGAPQ